MFGLSITSNYIKYIGIAIVSIMLFIALYTIGSSIKDFWYNTFNIETTEQKVVRLESNEKILKQHVKDVEKEVVIKTAIVNTDTVITNEIINEETKVKTSLDKLKLIKTKPKHIVKVKKSESKLTTAVTNDGVVEVTTVEVTELPKIVIERTAYEEQGAETIDLMFQAYNIVKEIK